jgi:hypothetical protein
MVWLYPSPIPVGRRRGVLYFFKLFLPAVTDLEEEEGIGTLCVSLMFPVDLDARRSVLDPLLTNAEGLHLLTGLWRVVSC